MDRDTAVMRINDGLGFRQSGNPLEAKIALRLKEAQRDLEKGKTLPKFLLQEDQLLTLPAGSNALPLPDGFIRLDDDNLPHFITPDSAMIRYMEYVRSYRDAVTRVMTLQSWPSVITDPLSPATIVLAPQLFTIRKTTIDFIAKADRDYSIRWNYYKAGAILDSNIENEWLDDDNAPEWLIGEAGYRMALDTRDQTAQQLFDTMRTAGRAAVFGDMLADEDAGGPFIMGAKL